MIEETKLSWKGRSESFVQLYVGVAKTITQEFGLVTITLEGRELYQQKDSFFVLTEKGEASNSEFLLHSCKNLSHIQEGDLLMIKGRSVRSIFRNSSRNNFIFATQRCNSNCLMCSQPPIDVDDTHDHFLAWDYAIDLIQTDLIHLTITGGEPTLWAENLVKLVNKLLGKFPKLRIDVLSNGRLPAKDDFIEILADISQPERVVFAIPVYSDLYNQHDYIVQAKDAFYQTCLGIHKLGNLGFLIEIRVVLHELTSTRLLPLAKFIHKNFPFTYHITFMGLEIIGYTKANKDKLIIKDNSKALQNLELAMTFLEKWDYNASIYNTPLCHLPAPLWKFARKSISDWKNSYHDDCTTCIEKENCSGFFSWNLKYAEVSPIIEKEPIFS